MYMYIHMYVYFRIERDGDLVGFGLGLVGVAMCSWGNDMMVYMVGQ